MRLLKALVISLLIYALLIWLLFVQYAKIEKSSNPKNNHVIKIDIQNISLPVPASKAKPIQEPVAKKKMVEKKPVKKKIVKKKPVKKTPPKKKVVVKKKPSPKKVLVPKKVVKKKSTELETFENDMVYIAEPMFTPKQVQTANPYKSYPNKKIQKLYGSEFHGYTATQKKFIEKELDRIHYITQSVLNRRGYPPGAGRTGQQGMNVVSFNLHPNGDISDLRLKTRTGYRALDDNTLSLIKVAYKDYPYPQTRTKIVFNVTYTLYGY